MYYLFIYNAIIDRLCLSVSSICGILFNLYLVFPIVRIVCLGSRGLYSSWSLDQKIGQPFNDVQESGRFMSCAHLSPTRIELLQRSVWCLGSGLLERETQLVPDEQCPNGLFDRNKLRLIKITELN